MEVNELHGKNVYEVDFDASNTVIILARDFQEILEWAKKTKVELSRVQRITYNVEVFTV